MEKLRVLLLFGCYFYLFFISLFPSHETLQVRAIPEQLHGSAESPVLPPSVHGAKIASYHQQTSACVHHGSVGQDLFLGLLIHEALAPAIYWFFFSSMFITQIQVLKQFTQYWFWMDRLSPFCWNVTFKILIGELFINKFLFKKKSYLWTGNQNTWRKSQKHWETETEI